MSTKSDGYAIATGLYIAASDARVAALTAERAGDTDGARVDRELAEKFTETVERYEAQGADEIAARYSTTTYEGEDDE